MDVSGIRSVDRLIFAPLGMRPAEFTLLKCTHPKLYF